MMGYNTARNEVCFVEPGQFCVPQVDMSGVEKPCTLSSLGDGQYNAVRKRAVRLMFRSPVDNIRVDGRWTMQIHAGRNLVVGPPLEG